MSVGVAGEEGAVAVSEPVLVGRWSLGRALTGSGAALPLTGLTLLLAVGGVGLLAWRQGRDRVTVGPVSVDGRVRGTPSASRRRGLLEPRTVAVGFRPPDDLRPAHLGLLVDESVDPVDVSATVVDLAVRGHLTIEEVENSVLWFSRTDWQLVRTGRDGRDGVPATGSDDPRSENPGPDEPSPRSVRARSPGSGRCSTACSPTATRCCCRS